MNKKKVTKLGAGQNLGQTHGVLPLVLGLFVPQSRSNWITLSFQMRISVVTQMAWDDDYGAATALRRLLIRVRLLPGSKASFLVLSPFSSKESSPEIALFRSSFPMAYNFVGGPKGIVVNLWNWILEHSGGIKWSPSSEEISALEKSDVIHLNSISLIWLARKLKGVPELSHIPIVCHIREHANTQFRPPTLNYIDGLIFIDPLVQESLYRICSTARDKSFIVLPDPGPTSKRVKESSTRNPENFNVAVIGRLDPMKGMKFACEVFEQVQDPNWKLSFVGTSSRNPFRLAVKKESRAIEQASQLSDGKIEHLGHIAGLSESGFYSETDVIMRCEPFPAPGLTVYEGLAYGCYVILPGSAMDYEALERIEQNRRNVFFAEPRSVDSYLEALNRAYKKKLQDLPLGEIPQPEALDYAEESERYLDFMRSLTND